MVSVEFLNGWYLNCNEVLREEIDNSLVDRVVNVENVMPGYFIHLKISKYDYMTYSLRHVSETGLTFFLEFGELMWMLKDSMIKDFEWKKELDKSIGCEYQRWLLKGYDSIKERLSEFIKKELIYPGSPFKSDYGLSEEFAEKGYVSVPGDEEKTGEELPENEIRINTGDAGWDLLQKAGVLDPSHRPAGVNEIVETYIGKFLFYFGIKDCGFYKIESHYNENGKTFLVGRYFSEFGFRQEETVFEEIESCVFILNVKYDKLYPGQKKMYDEYMNKFVGIEYFTKNELSFIKKEEKEKVIDYDNGFFRIEMENVTLSNVDCCEFVTSLAEEKNLNFKCYFGYRVDKNKHEKICEKEVVDEFGPMLGSIRSIKENRLDSELNVGEVDDKLCKPPRKGSIGFVGVGTAGKASGNISRTESFRRELIAEGVVVIGFSGENDYKFPEEGVNSLDHLKKSLEDYENEITRLDPPSSNPLDKWNVNVSGNFTVKVKYKK